MRTLFVFTTPPHPPDHALRTPQAHALLAMKGTADIDVLTWRPPEVDRSNVEALRSIASDVMVGPWVGMHPGRAARVWRRARFVAGGEPAYVQALFEERGFSDAHDIARLNNQILDRHREAPYNLVVLGEDAITRFPLPDLGVPLVVHRWNTFDRVLTDINRSQARRWILLPLERRGWRRFDHDVCHAGDLIVTPTEQVAAEARAIAPRARVVWIPHGVQKAPLTTRPSFGADLAFIGDMQYAPNIDAVRWFATRCWSAIREGSPGSRFRIVGRNPTARVRSLQGGGVEVTGEVPEVTDACEGVRVGVVPLRAGMGIKTKTLELMAMGLPVVTLPSGAEGIAATRDDGLIVVADARGFVDAVAHLLAEPEDADRLGAAAREFVSRHHSWEAMRARYREHLVDLVQSRHVAP